MPGWVPRSWGVCPGSNVVEGTIAEWQDWTGLAFPVSGEYVVPGALVPVSISVEGDLGRLAEPNVWMRHRVRGQYGARAVAGSRLPATEFGASQSGTAVAGPA